MISIAPDAGVPSNQSLPTPGSKRAKSSGCICPAGLNNNGKAAPYPPNGWFIAESCPIHVVHVVLGVPAD